MSPITPLIPRRPVPDLELPTVAGGTWRLADQKPENFTMIVVYRGLHCPICSNYLKNLDNKLEDFAAKGVASIAVTSDGRERAEKAKQEWGLDDLTIGYDLDLGKAREWGLYISSGIGKTSSGLDEPDLFVEPGLFLVRPDGTLYFASVQTMPFARPNFSDVLAALDVVLKRDYPARGEVVDHNAPKAAE